VAKKTGKKPSASGKTVKPANAKAKQGNKADLAGKTVAKVAKTAKPPTKVAAKVVKQSQPVAAKTPLKAPKLEIRQVTQIASSKNSKSKEKESDKPGSNGAKTAHPSRSPRIPVPPPVPLAHSANGRAKKNQAGLSARELDHFRDLLLAKRRELIGDMSSMEREALRSGGGSNLSNLPIHMADMGTDNYEQEFTLGLVQKERDLLKEINLALAKIQNGNYGICEGSGQPIIKERLEYQPWARYSVDYQRKLERHIR